MTYHQGAGRAGAVMQQRMAFQIGDRVCFEEWPRSWVLTVTDISKPADHWRLTAVDQYGRSINSAVEHFEPLETS